MLVSLAASITLWVVVPLQHTTGFTQFRRGRAAVGVGVFLHVGPVFRTDWALARWRRGALEAGGIGNFAFHLKESPAARLRRAEITGVDSSWRIAPTLGHSFNFAQGRVRLGAHAFVGLAGRAQTTTLHDVPHGFQRSHRYRGLFLDAGVLLCHGVGLTPRFGVSLDLTIPAYVRGVRSLPARWQVSPPSAGVTGVLSF